MEANAALGKDVSQHSFVTFRLQAIVCRVTVRKIAQVVRYKPKIMKTKLFLPLVVLSLSLGTVCGAGTAGWLGTTASWTSPGNWTLISGSPSFPPGPGDTAEFDAGSGLVDLASAGIVGNVTFTSLATGSYSFFDSLDYWIPVTSDTLTVPNGGAVTMNGSGALTFANTVLNWDTLTVKSGNLSFIGTNVAAFGSVAINGGTVCVTAFFPSQFTATFGWTVNSGGTLKGSGVNSTTPGGYATLIGNVTLNTGGTLLAGCSVGTANIQGDVLFAAGAQSDFELSQPNTVGSGLNDLFNVDGSLTLNGTLNIVNLPGFGAGSYRLFNYTGAFTDNGVQLGPVPAGFAARLDLSTTNQVNLVVLLSARLNIALAGNNIVLSWTNASYHLQSAPALGTSAVWTNMSGTSPVTVPIGSSSQFFRLINL